MFAKIQSGQETILKELTDVRERLTMTENTVANFDTRWNDLDKLLLEIREKTLQIDTLQTKVSNLERVIEQQSQKLVDLEDRSRRSNLVVFGVEEDSEENDESLRRKVIDGIFERKLKQKCSSVARIHRIGRPGATKRPVIVYFQDFLEKETILRRAKNLKGTDIFVQNDFSRATLRKRKLLWKTAKDDKANGKEAYLIHDKLKLDGTL